MGGYEAAADVQVGRTRESRRKKRRCVSRGKWEYREIKVRGNILLPPASSVTENPRVVEELAKGEKG